MTLGQMIYWSINTYTALLQNIWWWWMAPFIALRARNY